MNTKEEKIKIPNTKITLQTLKGYFEEQSSEHLRPLIEGYIIKSFQDGLLATENLIELKFSDYYYEYVGFSFENNVVEVLFWNYFNKRVPKLHFLTTYKEILRHPKIFEFSNELEKGPMIDSFLAYLDCKVGLLPMMSYPFTIEIVQDSKLLLRFDAGTMIPVKKDFFIPEGSGVIRIKKRYLNQEKEFQFKIPGGVSLKIGASLDIDTFLSSKIYYKINKNEYEKSF